MRTEERLRGNVKTILRQLARQVGGARVMQIGSTSAIEGADRDSNVADEVPNSPSHGTRSHDHRGETFGDPSEADLQHHDELRRDPSSFRESRVNGENDGSYDEDYIPVPREIGAPWSERATRYVRRECAM